MHRSIAGHNPYNPFILTIVYSKNLTTSWLLTTEHLAMFVVEYIHIQIYGQVMDLSIPVEISIHVCERLLTKRNVADILPDIYI